MNAEEILVSQHRGYNIYKIAPTSFVVKSPSGCVITRAGSIWSCIAYIDELLSP